MLVISWWRNSKRRKISQNCSNYILQKTNCWIRSWTINESYMGFVSLPRSSSKVLPTTDYTIVRIKSTDINSYQLCYEPRAQMFDRDNVTELQAEIFWYSFWISISEHLLEFLLKMGKVGSCRLVIFLEIFLGYSRECFILKKYALSWILSPGCENNAEWKLETIIDRPFQRITFQVMNMFYPGITILPLL